MFRLIVSNSKRKYPGTAFFSQKLNSLPKKTESISIPLDEEGKRFQYYADIYSLENSNAPHPAECSQLSAEYSQLSSTTQNLVHEDDAYTGICDRQRYQP